jgi:hypothetical protein
MKVKFMSDKCLGRFWAKSVEIQLFPSPTGYILISFGFLSLI